MAERKARDKRILTMRQNGATLAEISSKVGLTIERVRQIAADVTPSGYQRECACCGVAFTATSSRNVNCGDCRCVTCGSPIPRRRVVAQSRYCKQECEPGFARKGAASGTRFHRVELGIYVKRYVSTGAQIPSFYCFDQVNKTWVRFDTLEEARAYRASGAWSRRQSGIPG